MVRAIAFGLSNDEIAEQLAICTKTVKNHIHAVLERLDLNTRAQLASLAASQRLIGKPHREKSLRKQ